MTKRRKIMRWGEFEKRLLAKDPEAIQIWQEFREEFLKSVAPIAEWYEQQKSNPATARQVAYLEQLADSTDPNWKNIADHIDIESFIAIMKNAPGLENGIRLPMVPETFLLSPKNERLAEVKKLAHQGLTDEQMSQRLFVSVSTIKRDRKELGLFRRAQKR